MRSNKADRFKIALEKLEFIGFPLDETFEWKWDEAAERFNSTTLWRVFGLDRCVEVDAIPAKEIRHRIETAILAHVDQREWAFLQVQEEREKRNVFDLVKRLEEGAA